MEKRFIAVSACVLLAASGIVTRSNASDPAPALQAPAEDAPHISQADLLARLARNDSDLVVLDVRTPAEFAAGHVPGARNLSHDQLAGRLDELAAVRDKQVVLYCRSGRRTLLAEDTLRQAGFTRLLHLEGDYLAWEAEHRPIEKTAE
jgi:rhodanese-related sulfurtransferase